MPGNCPVKRLTKTQALQKICAKQNIAGIDLHFPDAATAVGLLSFFIGAGCVIDCPQILRLGCIEDNFTKQILIKATCRSV